MSAHCGTAPDRRARARAAHVRGQRLAAQGDAAQAEQAYRDAIALDGRDPDPVFGLAVLLYRRGAVDGAVRVCRDLLAQRPDHAPAHNNLGVFLYRSGRVEEAERCYREALRLAPDYAEASNNLGNALTERGAFAQAESAYRHAAALRPAYADAHFNLANSLFRARRHAPSLEHYDRALACDPTRAEYYCNRGVALGECARHAEAEADLRRAIALRPDYAQAHNNLAHCLLMQGRYEEGWRAYEWRWEGCVPRPVRPALPLAVWTGQGVGAGQRLLILGEQGFGDQLQFARYLAMATQRFTGGVAVVLAAPVAQLVRRSFPMVEVLDRIPENTARWDWQCALLSLPAAFRTAIDTIPAAAHGYLVAGAVETASWSRRIAQLGLPRPTLRVGLAWKPGPRMETAPLREISLAALGPCFELASCAWFCLQPQHGQGGGPAGAAHWIDWSADLHSFDDTAALVANLDLVISVDTAVAHLAGAMGRPVWLLNRHASEWRWLWGREDSPWYPSMRLFNQAAPGDWSRPVQALCAALRSFRT